MQQVFINLLSNAIKFSYNDQFIKINAKLITKNQIMIEVTDSGVGIAQSEH